MSAVGLLRAAAFMAGVAAAPLSGSMDPTCIAWGCDCQFLADLYGFNNKTGARVAQKIPNWFVPGVYDFWEKFRCTTTFTPGSVPILYGTRNPEDMWQLSGPQPKRCFCPGATGGSVFCCPKPAHGCSRLSRLRQRVLSQKIVGIVHVHARKAGGTTMGSVLSSVVTELGWALIHWEGQMVSPDLIRQLQMNGWLVVGTFRDPIDRIISSFNYEVRFGGLAKIAEYNRKYENALKFVDWIKQQQKGVADGHRDLWKCAINCFTQWWGGTTKTSMPDTSPAALKSTKPTRFMQRNSATLDNALRSVEQFDFLVEIGSGHMKMANASLTAFFRAVGADKYLSRWKGYPRVMPPLASYQALTERRLPHNISTEAWQLLIDNNQNDLALHRYTRTQWAYQHCDGHAN